MTQTQTQESQSIKERLGAELQRQRNRRGLTQTQLANLAGVSPKYIGEIERGDANPTLDLLVKVVETIGWDPLARGTDSRDGQARNVIDAPLLAELQRTVGRLDVVMALMQAMLDPQTQSADLQTLAANLGDWRALLAASESAPAVAGHAVEGLPPRRRPGRPRNPRPPGSSEHGVDAESAKARNGDSAASSAAPPDSGTLDSLT